MFSIRVARGRRQNDRPVRRVSRANADDNNNDNNMQSWRRYWIVRPPRRHKQIRSPDGLIAGPGGNSISRTIARGITSGPVTPVRVRMRRRRRRSVVNGLTGLICRAHTKEENKVLRVRVPPEGERTRGEKYVCGTSSPETRTGMDYPWEGGKFCLSAIIVCGVRVSIGS